MDTNKHQLVKNNKIIPLTTGEFALLRIFFERPDHVMSRESLLNMTKGYDCSALDRSIDICIGRLRRKIEPDPSAPVYLRTVWGAGYIFSAED